MARIEVRSKDYPNTLLGYISVSEEEIVAREASLCRKPPPEAFKAFFHIEAYPSASGGLEYCIMIDEFDVKYYSIETV